MSQMLHLELTEEVTPLDHLAEVLRDTATQLGLLAEVADGPTPADATLTLTSGLWVSIAPSFISGEDTFVADFGMARAATIDLQVDGTRDVEPQYEQMLQMVLGLLAALPGDAVLHYAYATVWLVRRDGQLILNEEDDVWPPERLASVDVPYERSHLAFVTT